MAEVLTPDEVLTAMRAASDQIARGVRVCDERYRAYLEADRACDQAYARAYLAHEGPQTEKRHAAELGSAREREARDAADAAYRYAKDRARALELELGALQSANRSVLALYGAVGVTER